MATKLWDGRFSAKTDRLVEAFTASVQIDKRLYRHDIQGSMAHCRMLAETGVLTAEEAEQLVEGLVQIQREIERNDFEFNDTLEDIHMHIEARLLQIVGKTALKLHTARSRNDQVALDLRLFLRDKLELLIADMRRLRGVLVELAAANTDVVLPGYTHLQRAQPILLAHHLMAYYEMFSRDQQRLTETLGRVNVLPLGAAALAGTTYPIDPAFTASLLSFDHVAANSVDAVADRDFIVEFLADAAIAMMHMSRLAEELILWASCEFGFINLPDAFATGSSIMPQKKNPDVPELIRGKTGGVFGNLVAMLTTMKSLPLAYNRDMQEDKRPLFETVDTFGTCIEIVARMLPELTFNRETMRAAAGQGFLNATDLADYLVEKGVAFRDAHKHAGRLVALALEKGKELDELTLDEMQTVNQLIETDVFEALSLETVVNRRNSMGGTGAERVAAAISSAKSQLEKEMTDDA
jgi:argininosuccinate lyase